MKRLEEKKQAFKRVFGEIRGKTGDQRQAISPPEKRAEPIRPS